MCDRPVHKIVDIKGQVCPYTFVRSKLALERMNTGEVLKIVTDHGPASENIPKSMINEGQRVLGIDQVGENEWHIFVQKNKGKE
jgi:TusA-related sulfurtransferase